MSAPLDDPTQVGPLRPAPPAEAAAWPALSERSESKGGYEVLRLVALKVLDLRQHPSDDIEHAAQRPIVEQALAAASNKR